MSALLWAGVGLISGVGALLRFTLHRLVQERRADVFPLGTLTVNVLGSLILGALHGAGVGGDEGLLFGTALLGSFTTFSTWMVESERLAGDGETTFAAANILVSLTLGLAAVALGWALGSVF